MKEEDLLQAIGEVDDIYIKRAHQKTRWNAILTALATILILGTGAVLLMPADYLLMRMETDGTANTGYADPRSLVQDDWTSMERTDYQENIVVGTTQIRRSLYGGYKLTREEDTGIQTIVGTVRGDDYRWDYVDREDRRDTTLKAGGNRRWLTTRYSTDLVDRINSFYIHAGTAYGNPGTLLNALQIEYMSTGVGSGLVTRQSHVLDDGTVTGYRTFSYINQKLSNTKDYDGAGNLLSYTDYVYDGYLCTATTYLANGTMEEQELIRYDWLDRVKWREIYSAQGQILRKETYRYRPWELFVSMEGLWTLFAILSLATTLSLAVWDSRFQRGDRIVQRLTGRQEEALAEDIQALIHTMDVLSAKLDTHDCEEASISCLITELQTLNAHLEQLIGKDK